MSIGCPSDAPYWDAANGRLGIGTTSPNAKLSLGATAAAQKLLLYESGNIKFGFGTPGAGEFRVFTAGGGGSVIGFGQVSSVDGSTYSEFMRINGSGNVGIGTTSPQTELEVAGTISATDLYVNGSQVNSTPWTVSGTDVYRAGGNVGIGTMAPSYALDIGGGRLGGIGSAGVFFGSGGKLFLQSSGIQNAGPVTGVTGPMDVTNASGHSVRLAYGSGKYWSAQTDTNVNIDWQPTGGSGQFQIDTDNFVVDTSSGNVGIGTTSPANTLDVSGTARVAGDAEVEGDISATTVKVAGTGSEVCNPANYGMMRRNPTTGKLQICMDY